MDAQRWYDIVYSAQTAGCEDEAQLVQCMLIRTGNREPAREIRTAYQGMLEYAGQFGYSSPMTFLEDYFPGKYTKALPTSEAQIGKLRAQRASAERSSPNETIGKSSHDSPHQEALAGKTKKSQTPESVASKREEGFLKQKILKPGRLRREGAAGSPIEIPSDVRSKIVKAKKSAKYYREMSPKEKEIDNRFDYFLMQSRRDESGKFFYDNTEGLAEFPLIGSLFNDIDVEFRRVMAEIHCRNKRLVKDKSRWVEEIGLLQSYFQGKLGIEAQEDSSGKRLAAAVAHLMKKLQQKIFETSDHGIIRILLYFKVQLGAFYNHYRK